VTVSNGGSAGDVVIVALLLLLLLFLFLSLTHDGTKNLKQKISHTECL